MIDKIEYQKMFEVEQDHWWYKGLRYYLFYWIEKYYPKKILDAGCGTGINAFYLKEAGYAVYGMDFSTDSLEFCKKRGLGNLNQGVIQSLPYADKEFDLIYCMDVIGILEENEADIAIKEANRCLKNGGIYILNAAAFQFLYSAQDIAWHIKKRYTKKQLVDQLEKNNFRIIKSTYRVFLLFPLVILSKLITRLKINLLKLKNIDSDTDKTNFILDFVLSFVMKLEFFMSQYVDFPVGSSVFIVAQKFNKISTNE